MIKIFDSQDTDFSSNGNIAIEPLSCIEIKKKSLNGWYIEVEIPIKYKEYIVQDKLCVVKTKSKISPQAFSIYDISYTTKKISFKAEHVAFRARDYFLLDCRPTSLNGDAALNYINERTDNNSPFNIISDVETISTAYFIRKNLLEAWMTIEERWNGTFDFDNYDIYFKQNIGNDNGEIISYRKNLQDFKIYEDWSNVVTKLYPTGYDGIMLPENCIESDIQYDKYYTRTISFETNLSEEEKTETNLIAELRENANIYLSENKYPKVCYEITSNIVQSVDIGDIIHVKHPLVELTTEVQEYDYDLLTKKIKKLVFGNYNRDVKTKFDNIKTNLTNIVDKVSQQSVDIDKQTKRINNLNKTGIVYIDDNEILILDSLPKETAVDVIRIGLGGLGISENGVEGPFVTAITGKGINADCITTGLIKANRIEGYSQLLLEVQSHSSSIQGLNPVLESTGNGQLSLPDCAGEKLLEFTVEGKSEQETSIQQDGDNIFDLMRWKNNVASGNNGTATCDGKTIIMSNPIASDQYTNLFHMSTSPSEGDISLIKRYGVEIESSTQYCLSYDNPNSCRTQCFMFWYDENYAFIYASSSTVGATEKRIFNVTSPTNAKYCCIRFDNEGYGYDVTTLEVTNISLKKGTDSNYTEFVPNSPSPDYPSKIKSISGVENLFDKTLPYIVASYASTEETDTGIRVTSTLAGQQGGAYAVRYLLFDYSKYAGKKLHLSSNVMCSSTNHGAYLLCTCDSSGENRTRIALLDNLTSGRQRISVTLPTNITDTNKYLCLFLYSNRDDVNSLAGDYVEYNDLIISIGDDYEPYVPYGSNYLVEKIVGKNKFNSSLLEIAVYNLGTTGTVPSKITSTTRCAISPINAIKVQPNTVYTVSIPANSQIAIGELTKDRLLISQSGWKTTTTYTFTTSSTTEYLCMNFMYGNSATITNDILEIFANSTQLELGSQATEIEEYKEAISLIDLKGNKLCSNKDLTVKDCLTVKNGLANIDKKIDEIILNGSEPSWGKWTGTPPTGYSVFYNQDYKTVLSSTSDLMCSSFECVESTWLSGKNAIGLQRTLKEIYISIESSIASTVDELKTWLSKNPVTINYTLDTPKTIDLSEVSIETVQSDCTLTLEEELDTDMYVKYIKNNPYNEVYPTKAEANALIELTAEQILNSVSSVEILTKNNYVELNEKFDGYTPSSQTAELQKSVEKIQTDTYTKTEINTKLTDGSVTKVQTISGTFDENGMTYEKTNAPTTTTINEVGVGTKKSNADEYVLFAGYVDDNNTQYEKYKGQTIVASENMLVKHYLVMGSNSRIEDYEDGTGIFYLG